MAGHRERVGAGRAPRARAASRWMNAARDAPTVDAKCLADQGMGEDERRAVLDQQAGGAPPPRGGPAARRERPPVTAASTSRSTSGPITAAARRVAPAATGPGAALLDRLSDRGRQLAPGARRGQLDQEQRVPAAASVQLRGTIGADDAATRVEIERTQRDGGHARDAGPPPRTGAPRPP